VGRACLPQVGSDGRAGWRMNSSDFHQPSMFSEVPIFFEDVFHMELTQGLRSKRNTGLRNAELSRWSTQKLSCREGELNRDGGP
jgi:hypothetical protein